MVHRPSGPRPWYRRRRGARPPLPAGIANRKARLRLISSCYPVVWWSRRCHPAILLFFLRAPVPWPLGRRYVLFWRIGCRPCYPDRATREARRLPERPAAPVAVPILSFGPGTSSPWCASRLPVRGSQATRTRSTPTVVDCVPCAYFRGDRGEVVLQRAPLPRGHRQ